MIVAALRVSRQWHRFLLLSLFPVSVPPENGSTQISGFPSSRWVFPPIPWPEDNPYSPARAELGKILFFDGRLSANGVVSCAFCHEPAHAFAASTPLSKGVNGKLGSSSRANPHQPRLGQIAILGWPGAHAGGTSYCPVTNPDEMGMTADLVVQRTSRHQRLRAAFCRRLWRQRDHLRANRQSHCDLRAHDPVG